MDPLGLLRNLEAKSLECKRDDSPAAAILRTVVAFANTAGGTILNELKWVIRRR